MQLVGRTALTIAFKETWQTAKQSQNDDILTQLMDLGQAIESRAYFGDDTTEEIWEDLDRIRHELSMEPSARPNRSR